MKFKEIRSFSGLSQQAFSDKYKIPKRTIENWESGKRNPPEYVISLLERAVKEDYIK
nr:MAG TPA: putative transcriptional regulator [Caudoviricetes sp.]